MIDYEKFRIDRNSMGGFNNEIGLVITTVSEGHAEGEIVLNKMHANPIGSIHGGVVFSMADTVGAVSTAATGCYVTTVSGNINYLNAVKDCEKLLAEANAVKMGRNLAVSEVMIRNEKGVNIAFATMTYHYLGDKVPFPYIIPDVEEKE